LAENPFFNRVDERNGSVIMDISDTTATANDVLSGKKFYSASGAPTIGTLVLDTITTATVELGNSVSLSPGNIELSFDVSKTGYTPIGIIGYNLFNRGIADKIFLSGMIVHENTAIFYGKVSENITIGASANVTIIYIKS